jgi:hypothetical protein
VTDGPPSLTSSYPATSVACRDVSCALRAREVGEHEGAATEDTCQTEEGEEGGRGGRGVREGEEENEAGVELDAGSSASASVLLLHFCVQNAGQHPCQGTKVRGGDWTYSAKSSAVTVAEYRWCGAEGPRWEEFVMRLLS